MSVEIIYMENDNLVTLTGLQDSITLDYINGATVILQLLKMDRTEVGSPVSMGYVADSDGDYRGLIEDTTTLDENKQYRARITADNGPGFTATWEQLTRAQRRFSQ